MARNIESKDRKRKKKLSGKRAEKLVDECLIISSNSEKEGQISKVTAAKRLDKRHHDNGSGKSI